MPKLRFKNETEILGQLSQEMFQKANQPGQHFLLLSEKKGNSVDYDWTTYDFNPAAAIGRGDDMAPKIPNDRLGIWLDITNDTAQGELRTANASLTIERGTFAVASKPAGKMWKESFSELKQTEFDNIDDAILAFTKHLDGNYPNIFDEVKNILGIESEPKNFAKSSNRLLLTKNIHREMESDKMRSIQEEKSEKAKRTPTQQRQA